MFRIAFAAAALMMMAAAPSHALVIDETIPLQQKALNPQPLPPGPPPCLSCPSAGFKAFKFINPLSLRALNPQPLPPRRAYRYF